MKRSKRHKVKQEMPDASSSRTSDHKEHDLAYYIHDRVELLHQVFSVLKHKELKAMAPECVRHISINDLQELCMEELLGISSKRLCAILDGADPPSDTESSTASSPDRLETISLDSISSDEEILSQVSSKKSKKHKHRSKSKSKKRRSKDSSDRQQEDKSRRAGLTMLELLELQARARAIRAQLQKEQAMAASTEKPSETAASETTDDEVEIKEEAAEVVEISSEDEKPNVKELNDRISATRNETDSNNTHNNSGTITKKVNDLVITVPQAKSSRKIKLKRNTCSNTNNKVVEKDTNIPTTSTYVADTSNTKRNDANNSTKASSDEAKTKRSDTETIDLVTEGKDTGKGKEKKKKRKKDKQKEKEGSDHDEITLQLSDTEKMDLLEDLEGKKFEESNETEDSSEDSDSENCSNDENEKHDKVNRRTTIKVKVTSKETIREKVIESNTADDSNLSNETLVTRVQQDKVQSIESNMRIDKESESNHGLNKDANKGKETEPDLGSSHTKERKTEVMLEKDTESLKESDKKTKPSSPVADIIIDAEKEETLQFADNAIEITRISDIPLQSSDDHKIKNVEEKSKEAQKDTTQMNNDDTTEQRNNVGQEVQNNIEITIENKELTDKETNKDSETHKDTSILKNTNFVNSNTDENLIDTEIQNQRESENINKEDSKDKSEGELSDRDSSEVEASDIKSEVVCISDEEEKRSKKKKKKDKKSKKEKKSKKNKDFRESADQNFYTQPKDKNNSENNDVVEINKITEKVDPNTTDVAKDSNFIKTEDKSQDGEVILISESTENDDTKTIKTEASRRVEMCNNTDLVDNVYEILELSDDSSCYEVEEISISKEPTTEEIEALSAKLDEIERDRSINVNHIDRDRETDKETQDIDTEDFENVSWKDRYLKSTKVKKVLTTANILNAIRKKNLDLKKKLKDSKKAVTEDEVDPDKEELEVLEEGSIQHYNTLETSTKFVDPVKEVENSDNVQDKTTGDENIDKGAENINTNKEINENIGVPDKENSTDDSSEKGKATKEMKKEAKQLLKMYKMLLKYNDITKQKDSNKKKKKKKKDKKKDKPASQASVAT